MKETTILLKAYLEEQRLTSNDKLNHPLFFGHRRSHFTRAGISYILKKYVCTARELRPQFPDTVSPHVMRHTKAMHLLQAGVNLVYIRDIWGRVDIGTTEVYARTDTEMKRLALEKVDPTPVPASVPSWAKDKGLMQWPKAHGRSCS